MRLDAHDHLVILQLLPSLLLHSQASLLLLHPLLLQLPPPLLQVLLVVLPGALLSRLPLSLLGGWHVAQQQQQKIKSRNGTKSRRACRTGFKAAVSRVGCRSCDLALARSKSLRPPRRAHPPSNIDGNQTSHFNTVVPHVCHGMSCVCEKNLKHETS